MVDALARAVRPSTVTAIVNVGDDLEFLGLQVSPDLDTGGGQLRLRCDHERAHDGFALRTSCENRSEHLPYQLRPLVRGEERDEPCLRPVQAFDRHDREHSLSLHA